MWEYIFIKMLRQLIRHGTLCLHLPDGKEIVFGDKTGTPVTVRLSDPHIFRRFVISPELAIGEAWMDGTLTIDNDDLSGFLQLGTRNFSLGMGYGAEGIISPALRRLKQYNPVSRARKNVAHHYDLSGGLYDLFLDEDKQYSCGYFRKISDSLETAQQQKKTHIAAKLCLEPGMSVLDIGCGWGGMALTLARDFNVSVVGVTLSEEQYKTARARVQAAGLENRIDIRLTDYRNIRESFDRVVSVGMFEHVGIPHYREFFSHLCGRLKNDGVALLHTIGRIGPPGRTSPWITKYIFPGGYTPALSEILPVIESEALWVTDIEVWRQHYAETLRHWNNRFMANLDKVQGIYDARFCRMWRYYLTASEMSFRSGLLVVFQLQLTRGHTPVPVTRDYISLSDRKNDLA